MFQLNEPTVVHDTIDDEVLVIRNDTGAYYSMLGPAADVWAGVAAGLDQAALVAMLASRYEAGPVEIAAAVDAFVAELLAEHLVREGPAAEGGAPPPPREPKVPFDPPSLEVYTDMADLLLFDPIHEVTPDGWPHVADSGT